MRMSQSSCKLLQLLRCRGVAPANASLGRSWTLGSWTLGRWRSSRQRVTNFVARRLQTPTPSPTPSPSPLSPISLPVSHSRLHQSLGHIADAQLHVLVVNLSNLSHSRSPWHRSNRLHPRRRPRRSSRLHRRLRALLLAREPGDNARRPTRTRSWSSQDRRPTLPRPLRPRPPARGSASVPQSCRRRRRVPRRRRPRLMNGTLPTLSWRRRALTT